MRRRIGVLATGSMGDVRPYVHLAARLQRAGHEVTLLANGGYEALAAQAGLTDCRRVWVDAATMLQFQQATNAGTGTFSTAYLDSWFNGYERILEGMEGCGLVLSRNPLVAPIARHVGAEFWQVSNLPDPAGLGLAMPYPTRWTPLDLLHTCTSIPWLRNVAAVCTHLGRPLEHLALVWAERRNLKNLMSYPRRHLLALERLGIEQAERAVAVPPAKNLLGQSRHLLPPPRGTQLTGLWHTDEPGWEPPAALQAFLDKGAAPVFLGFGSNPCTPAGRSLPEAWAPIVRALRRAGARVLLSVGWGFGDQQLPELQDPGVLCVGDVPHGWLLPRLAGAVSHLGVGTAVAIARADIACLPVPFTQDQFFWSWRLRDLGIATPAVKPDAMPLDRLTRCVEQLLSDPALPEAARALCQLLQAEDGLQSICDLVSQRLETSS